MKELIEPYNYSEEFVILKIKLNFLIAFELLNQLKKHKKTCNQDKKIQEINSLLEKIKELKKNIGRLKR